MNLAVDEKFKQIIWLFFCNINFVTLESNIKNNPINQAERFETSFKKVYSNHSIGNVNQTLDKRTKLNKIFVCQVHLDSYICLTSI